MLAPRADQPLLGVAEYAFPTLRTLYFTKAEAATFDDANEHAERYRLEAEKLNELERRNRTEGVALDDFDLRRISSFLKSYGEMRNGEQFVMGEIRARARERLRWTLGAALLMAGLLLVPGNFTRIRRFAVGAAGRRFSFRRYSWDVGAYPNPRAPETP